MWADLRAVVPQLLLDGLEISDRVLPGYACPKPYLTLLSGDHDRDDALKSHQATRSDDHGDERKQWQAKSTDPGIQ